MALIQAPHTNGLSPLQFPILAEPRLAHGVFHRHGGASPAPWDSLNVGLAVGDAPERVAGNRRHIRRALGLAALAAARQVHGDGVAVLHEAPAGELDGIDAMVTDVPGLGLMIQQADCQAVLFFDPVNRAVGIAHSGWRGSVANIIAKTVATMSASYGTDPGKLRAAVSPSLGPCCGEFVNHRRELPDSFRAFEVRPDHFDFWAVSRHQLGQAGVRDENITVAGVCTVCDRRFFSYRRDGTTGRNGSVIGLRP